MRLSVGKQESLKTAKNFIFEWGKGSGNLELIPPEREQAATDPYGFQATFRENLEKSTFFVFWFFALPSVRDVSDGL